MKNSDTKLKSDELNAIANRLKELRKEKGYTNYEHIAFALEMSRSAYWRLETGANFELKTLIKICRLLDISLEEFFQGIKIPNSKLSK
jgi:transcriptional regulator with XRE-family HTH domain